REDQILQKIIIGDDLSSQQRAKVVELIKAKHEAWALSLSELQEANVAPTTIHVNPDVPLPLEPTQRMSTTEAAAAGIYIDSLLQARLVRPIDPWEVKCVSNIIMVPK
ncbi:hypothetical protein HD553DRAFT_253089, partial [Filobasidium floriforme]